MFRSPDRLFRRYRETGEPRLLGRVFDRTAPELLRVALHLTRDRHAAEDAVQATFLSAIEKRAQWDAERPLLPWLLTILANHARQAFRRERRELLPRGDGVASDVADTAATAELARACDAALDALEEPYRPVLVLHLRHGLAAHEIAATLARPDSTVRNQIARGLDLLRRKLPAGIAGALALASLPGRGLAAVKAQVLATAPPPAALAPAAAAVGGIAFLGLGGLLMGKHVVVGLLALVAIGGFGWWGLRAPEGARPAVNEEPGGGSAAVAHVPAAEPPRASLGAGEREAVVAAPAPDTGSLRVEVVDATGAPVVGAACSLWREVGGQRRPFADAVTGDDGSAAFAALRPGKLEVMVDACDQRDASEIAAGQQLHLRMQLRDALTCDGVVVDRAGRPVAGAEIRCDHEWSAIVVARSAADGTFRARHLRGYADLWAIVAGLQPSKRHRLTERAPTTNLQFVVGEQAARLVGRVVDERAEPVAGARVFVGFDKREGSPFRQFERHILRADATGAFAIDWARPGTVVVAAVADDCDLERASWRELQVAVGESASVRVELGDGATVRGTVSDAAGKRLEGIAVSSDPQDIGFSPLDERSTTTDAQGAFVLRGLAPGVQHLDASRNHVGGRVSARLDVRSRGEQTWDAVLAEGADLAIRAVDSNGKPIANRYVTIALDVHRESGATTDDEGRHRWEHLLPGEYKVRLYGVGMTFALAERMLAPGPDEVEIRVDAAQLPSARVSGRVVDARGTPVPRAQVSLLAPGGGFSLSQQLDEQGRFRSELLPPASWSLSAMGQEAGLSWLSRSFELGVGQQLDLGDLVLPAAASLRVRLRGADGGPVRGAVVRLDATGNDLSVDEIDGSYRLAQTHPGKRVLYVFGPAIAPQRHELTLLPGERRELDLVATAAVPIVLEFHFVKQRPDDNGLVNAQLELTRVTGEPVVALHRFGYFTDLAQRIDRFPLGLAPGSYRLLAKEWRGRTVDVPLEVPAVAPAQPIVIDMR